MVDAAAGVAAAVGEEVVLSRWPGAARELAVLDLAKSVRTMLLVIAIDRFDEERPSAFVDYDDGGLPYKLHMFDNKIRDVVYGQYSALMFLEEPR